MRNLLVIMMAALATSSGCYLGHNHTNKIVANVGNGALVAGGLIYTAVAISLHHEVQNGNPDAGIAEGFAVMVGIPLLLAGGTGFLINENTRTDYDEAPRRAAPVAQPAVRFAPSPGAPIVSAE